MRKVSVMEGTIIVEHWREGVCIERIELTNEIVTRGVEQIITVPLGRYLEIVGEDELHIKRAERT